MNYIGFDKNNEKLQMGDICIFTIGRGRYEGIIIYDEESFSFAFEMEDETFPMILMSAVERGSIEKICNVMSTKLGDRFEFYRELYRKDLNK